MTHHDAVDAEIEAHRSGAVRFREHEPEELRVRRVGPDVASRLCVRAWPSR